MSTPFKTPISHGTPRNYHNFNHGTASEKSDSEESTASTHSEASSASSSDLTIVAIFDDLMRLVKQRKFKKLEEAFINFAEESTILWEKYMEIQAEYRRVQNMLDLKIHECSETEVRLERARRYLDQEKKRCERVQEEKEILEDEIEQIKKLLSKHKPTEFLDEARERLNSLNQGRKSGEYKNYGGNNLSAIQEVNSTGSLLSDYSVSRSEDDLDVSRHIKKQKREWNKQVPSAGNTVPEPLPKKRRSSSRIIEISHTDTVRATTTVLVSKDGPITATSIIESVPKSVLPSEAPPVSSDNGSSTNGYTPSGPPSNLVLESWARQSPCKPPRSNNNNNIRISNSNKNLRPHSLQAKIIVMPDSCVCCQKRIRFGKNAMKCRDCRSVCHPECKDNLPMPCVPLPNTPNHRNLMGVISDYTPTSAPMVPGLIVHCLNEIEQRGLNELGLFRIPGSEKDVKSLKERFLRGRGTPPLSQTDIHVICGCVKDFLRSLTEPLITFKLWNDFIQAADAKDEQDVVPGLYQCVSELPQPNRDTLAYLMLHLQKVAESKDCKMPADNLAKVFGPTIVGFSSDEPNFNNLLNETRKQIAVVRGLLSLPSDYWSSFVNVTQHTGRLQQTPSTDSLLRARFLTGSGSKSAKKQKLFATPPINN